MQSLYDIFHRHANASPDSPAFITLDHTVTFTQFISDVDRLAAGLVDRGLTSGERVCILAQNSVEYLQLVVACAKTGLIAYPINWRLSPAEIGGVVALAEPSLFVVAPDQLSQLKETDTGAIPLMAVLADEATDGYLPFSDLYGSTTQPPADVSADEPVAIISTAAVAAVPRGAVLTHGNFDSVSTLLADVFSLTAEDRFLAVLPFFHIAGLDLLFGLARAGGASVILPAFDPVAAAGLVDAHDVTLLGTFPPMLEMLLEARAQSGASWGSLKVCFGILNPPEVVQRLLSDTNAQYWTGYGQSETTGIVTLVNAVEKPGSVGKVVSPLEISLLDDLGEEVPLGETGEIGVRGPLVFAGYWRDEDATEYASRYGWHHTGDLGSLDEDGYLYYQGRKPEKELIKSGGENVYPAEVEHVIRELPQVADVCVIGVPDEKWGEAVKAVVELESDASLDADQLIGAVADKIASYKKPRHVAFVDALPRTDIGEIDRPAVKAAHG